MNTEYKGFTISQTGTTGKFVIAPDATSFNLNGYATVNAAKGAITKHLGHAAPVQEKHALPSLESNSATQGSAASDELPAPPAVVIVPASLLKRPYQSRNQREGGYGGKTWTTATGKARHYRGGNGTTRFTLNA